MKCNYIKISNFLGNDSIDNDTKEFVLNIFRIFFKNEPNSIIEAKILFLDLGFYEVDKSDLEDEDEEDLRVIDFYKISNLNINLKKMLFGYFLEILNGTSEINDFAESFFSEDLKIFIPYSDWKRINRKNKLNNLNSL
jgi:hypothetical protein